MASQPATPEAISERRKTYDFGCPECGGEVARKSDRGPPPMFCGKACKTAFFNRAKVDGAAIIMLAKAWRLARNNKADSALGAACLTEMSKIVDYMNERDRAEGRTTAMSLGYASRMRFNLPYVDASESIRGRLGSPRPERDQPEPQPDPLADILRQIADGHNDPRAIAAAALAKIEAA